MNFFLFVRSPRPYIDLDHRARIQSPLKRVDQTPYASYHTYPAIDAPSKYNPSPSHFALSPFLPGQHLYFIFVWTQQLTLFVVFSDYRVFFLSCFGFGSIFSSYAYSLAFLRLFLSSSSFEPFPCYPPSPPSFVRTTAEDGKRSVCRICPSQ
ncbi:hypothetical protein PENSPDRAFT_296392 [Peniophora sp. CONT]|nr:hypothetical protein PENSPDRAFT_296392 [Peniophora sp. CONT]